MDLLSDILKAIRLEGSVFFHSKLSAPWGIELPTGSSPCFHIILDGYAWLHSEGMQEPVRLNAGTAVLIRDGGKHWLADHPESPRSPGPDVGAAQANGTPMFQGARIDCNLICGTLNFEKDLHHPLMETLPGVLIVSGEQGVGLPWVYNTGRLMEEELLNSRPGAKVIVDRLCELFLIQILRNLKSIGKQPVSFVAALDDPYIRQALELIHADYQLNITLEKLAESVGLSRSAFAKRFHVLVGCPPMTYLTMWRMNKAKGLLSNPCLLLGQIATQVGYSSDVAFIRAFKRFFGKTPKDVRMETAA